MADWPTLDHAALHGLLGEFISFAEPSTEADNAAMAAIFLTTFGCMAGPQAHVLVSGRAHPGRLNTLIVGDSAFARKGTAQGVVNYVLRRSDPDFYSHIPGQPVHIIDSLASGEGLISAVWNLDALANQKGLPADKRLLVVEEEFAQILRLSGLGTASMTIRKAFDEGNISVVTKRKPMIVKGAHASIVGHITLEELAARMPKVDVMNGFANRFMFVLSKRSKILPDPPMMSEKDTNDIALDVAKALKSAKQIGLVVRSPSAQKLWEDFYRAVDDQRKGPFGAATARAITHVLRLSVVYALLDRSEKIEAAHQIAAEAMWKYAEDSLRYIFDVPAMSPGAEKLFEALLHAADSGLTYAQINTLFSMHGADAQSARDELAKLGHTVIVTEKTAGRPRTIVKLAIYDSPVTVGPVAAATEATEATKEEA